MTRDTHVTTGQPVASFDVSYSQWLRADGTLADDAPRDRLPDADTLTRIFTTALRTRAFDSKAINLQRTGRLGTYGSNHGQEAVGASIAAAMRDDDVLFPTYREISAQLWRGVQMQEVLLYWGGDERGSDFAHAREDFPLAVPIASQTLHAVGAAYAFKLRKQPRCAVCFLGDGASSKGDFYEAINAAGAWQLPVLFVVVNNGWAISVPRERQTACETLAQKAFAGGFAGEQVDGNDALALFDAANRALTAMRDGAGPHLIEALTYRMGDHTTSDDARRYRSAEIVEQHKAADPLERLRRYLVGAGLWSADAEESVMAEISADIDSAVQGYLGTPADAPTAMFDHLYAELPEALREQRAEVAKYAQQGGGSHE
jgi:pyruvate dehydrogenase E1 component alpha subunit